MNKKTLLLFFITIFLMACAKPLVTGNITATEPISKIIPSDPNTIYYAIKWAMEQMGYPEGPEDLPGGVVESKWVPVGAGSHYIELFDGKVYGANSAYYKMVIKITPLGVGSSKVEAYTEVNSIVKNTKSSGDKERAILAKISDHVRGDHITVTNLGVED